jgi:carboxypeptidase C (cathepsin A)
MTLARCQIYLALFAMLIAAPVAAQQSNNAESAPQAERGGIFSLMPADSVTDHVLKTPPGDLGYTATAGTLDLFGQTGDRTAKIFYTAYVAKDRTPDRPLTFAFNGGPGAASAYLHLGLVGPRVLEFGPNGDDGTTPTLKDNPDSWLRFTDLVLIDPIGTGWSRAATDEIAGNFYGVSQDADSLAKFIALYVQKNDRIASPKYLLGESYGGFRAAKVASALKNNQGILTSGAILLSPLMEGKFLFGADDDPVGAALRLPALAAAELERRDEFTLQALAGAEDFAMNEYLVKLAGPAPSGEESEAFFGKVSELTGIPIDVVTRTRGFVGDVYAKRSGPDGEIVSQYDAAYSRPDPYPEASYSRNDDPILDGYTRAYGGVFPSYAASHLGYATQMTYTLLNEDVNRRWEWGAGRGGSRQGASVSSDIRDLLSVIPTFRLMVVHGYSDAITPYGMSRYVLDHLPPALAEGRTSLKLYRGGHMFYSDPASRRAFFEDSAAFYKNATAD